MGYYDNPPIIQPGKGSEIVSSAILNAANSLSQGLLAAGERRRQEQKERRLTIQKLQDRKNETDLLYNEKQSDWASKQPTTNEAVDNKIRGIVQDKIKLAADSRIALLNETNQDKRQEYLKNIRNAEGFLNSSASFAKSVAEQTATWRLHVKGASVGVPGGYAINGKTDDEITQNTAVAEILGGMTQGYKEHSIDVSPDDIGDGVVMTVKGIDKDGNVINRTINSKTFGKSEEEGGDGLLIPVESLDTFYTKAKEDIVDKKGNIYPGYISDIRETVNIPSKGDSGGGIGKDQYQLVNGQRLQSKAIRSEIAKKAQITASGIIKTDGPARLRSLLDYSLGLQPGYYDREFKDKSVEYQTQKLTELLTDKSFNEMTKSLERTKGEDGETVYWNPSADVKIKDKETPKSDNTKEEKPEPTTYKEENYNSIITGYTPGEGENLQEGQIKYRTRKKLADNLNQLSGSAEGFITREELFKLYDQAVQTGKTTQANVDFAKKKFGNAQLFKRDGTKYRAITKYNLNTASGRVRLALDYTANEGERKMLQSKLDDAKLMDWMKANPRKSGETEQAYALRFQKRKK